MEIKKEELFASQPLLQPIPSQPAKTIHPPLFYNRTMWIYCSIWYWHNNWGKLHIFKQITEYRGISVLKIFPNSIVMNFVLLHIYLLFLLLFGFLETSFLFIYHRNSCVGFIHMSANVVRYPRTPHLSTCLGFFCKIFHYHAPLRADFDFSFNGNFMSILFGFDGQSVWAQISWANSVVLIATFFKY